MPLMLRNRGFMRISFTWVTQSFAKKPQSCTKLKTRITLIFTNFLHALLSRGAKRSHYFVTQSFAKKAQSGTKGLYTNYTNLHEIFFTHCYRGARSNLIIYYTKLHKEGTSYKGLETSCTNFHKFSSRCAPY